MPSFEARSAASSGESFTLLVKKYPDAKMGSHLHALEKGDCIEVGNIKIS